MTKGLRTTLWILSSLAVLWTVLALIGFFAMGGMMGGCGMMGGMRQSSMMGGGWMAGMMLHVTITWFVMLGLVGLFVYLIATGRRRPEHG